MAKLWALVCLRICPSVLPAAIKQHRAWKLTGEPGQQGLTLSLFAEAAVKRGNRLKNSHRRSSMPGGRGEGIKTLGSSQAEKG